MYAGRIVETAPTKSIFAAPRHPYTVGLLNSIPHLSEGASRLKPIPGQPPDLARLGQGCPFVPRCGHASADCSTSPIGLRQAGPDHLTACLHPERIAGAAA
jgi:oligopeptide/dipeptide ABC transporter ATP-binding protein